MVSKKNERIIITLSKKQIAWIREQASSKEVTPSKFLRWLIGLKISELDNYINSRGDKVQQQLDEMTRIANTKWLDKD